MLLPLATALLTVLLASGAGVTHWRLQDGVITAVNGNTVFSSNEPCGSCVGESEEGDGSVVYDREVAVLTRRYSTRRSSPAHVTQECPLASVQPRVGCGGRHCPHQSGLCPGEGSQRLLVSQQQERPVILQVQKMDQPSIVNVRNPVHQLLTCGDPVEFTAYDFLQGVAQRADLPPHPEPEVAMIFKKSEGDTAVDLLEVEVALRMALQENPHAVGILNQVGNFWRIKGNAQLSIECFRRALALSPEHPDVLLNLARVLFNHHYLDDTVFLAKRSLQLKQPKENAWLQYYTLGEAFKALEKYEQAGIHFEKALELNPSLHVAEVHLREIGRDKEHITNTYTLLIILTLMGVVLAIMYYLICYTSDKESLERSTAPVRMKR